MPYPSTENVYSAVSLADVILGLQQVLSYKFLSIVQLSHFELNIMLYHI